LILFFVKDEQDEDFDHKDAIYNLAQVVGWQNGLKEALGILERKAQKSFW
jgi:hypothetical protein